MFTFQKDLWKFNNLDVYRMSPSKMQCKQNLENTRKRERE